jgi:hypothetical protein
MTKPSTGESPPQPNEQPQPRRRNIYDYDGEYEFPTVQHWTATVIRAPSASKTTRPRFHYHLKDGVMVGDVCVEVLIPDVRELPQGAR